MVGWECCKNCDEWGQSVEANYCESILDGNPGCPVVDCMPGITFCIAVATLKIILLNTTIIYPFLQLPYSYVNYFHRSFLRFT